MTQDELERLAFQIHAVLTREGQAAARAAFVHAAAKLSPEQRTQLVRLLSAADRQTTGSLPKQSAVPSSGAATVSGAVQGQVVGINQGTMQQFFGTTSPGEDKATLLEDYLASLTSECRQLRLHRLVEQRQTGSEQQAVPQLKLQAVYTNLRTDQWLLDCHGGYSPVQTTGVAGRAGCRKIDRAALPDAAAGAPHSRSPGRSSAWLG